MNRYTLVGGTLAFAFVFAPALALAQTEADRSVMPLPISEGPGMDRATVPERDVEARLRARIAELEREVNELRELARAWQRRAEALSKDAASEPKDIHKKAQDMRKDMQQRMEVAQQKRMERQLRVGMKGDDVRLLQERLAKEAGVYPEGLVTGYYGPLTEAALERLKARHGVGEPRQFGPQTLAFLNQWLYGEGAQTYPTSGMTDSEKRPVRASEMDMHALLQQIRAGKRGEELRGQVPGTVKQEKKYRDGEDGKGGEDGKDGESAQ